MENPINSPEEQNPLHDQNPFEDPLLDALEQSIEGPPGLTDPLVEDSQYMDPLAKQLEQVEASIENTQPLLPEPVMEDGLNLQEDGLTASDDTSQQEEQESLDVASPLGSVVDDSQSLDLQDSGIHEHRSKQPLPKPRRGGGRLRRRVSIFRRLLIKRRGSLISGKNSRPRFCPETRKLIDEQKNCQYCEKYRHWPEGTNQEPRKCWYDWQMERNKNKTDHDSGEES